MVVLSLIEKNIRISRLSNLISEKGLDYKCGEEGVNLSGGEKQRISITRCLLRETQILLIDEATAALDNQIAFQIETDILSISGLTRIIVTHKLEETLLDKYDEIVVLKEGQVEEKGTFKDLMELRGYFYSLYNVTKVV